MAVTWHYGNIEPVSELMMKAYQRHHVGINNLGDIFDLIHQEVQSLRERDYKGEAFGKHHVLIVICLSERGESIITE